MFRVERLTGAVIFLLPLMLALLLTFASGWHRDWDQRAFNQLQQSQPLYLKDTITLIDLPHPAAGPNAAANTDANAKASGLRRSLSDLLHQLAERRRLPPDLILDYWFSAATADAQTLGQAVKALQKRGVRVYATFNLLDRHGAVSADYRSWHNDYLYDDVFDGAGHTLFELQNDLLTYRRQIQINQTTAAGATEIVAALPDIVSQNIGQSKPNQQIVFRYADESSVTPQRRGADQSLNDWVQALPLERTRHLIIGSFAADKDNALRIPGPALLAYALSGSLRQDQYRPATSLLGTIAPTAIVSLFGVMLCLMLFRGVRTRFPVAGWTKLGLLLGPIVTLGCAIVFVALFYLVLNQQIMLRIAGPLTAAAAFLVIAPLYARYRQNLAARDRSDMDDEEAARQYDVFISYAHDPAANMKWVREALYEPLSKLTNQQGKPLRIFFDSQSIRAGHQWKREIELALLGTQCFIPVFSDLYFTRSYCREEIELADQLRIEGRLQFIPIARNAKIIPERYLRKVQYLSADDPDLMDKVTAQLARISNGGGDA